MVARQDGLILQLPGFGCRALHFAVFGQQVIACFRTGISAIDADSAVELEGGEEHTTAHLLGTFGGLVGALGHIDAAAFGNAGLHHVVMQVVDGILQVVLGSGPAQTITGISTCSGDITH